MDWSTVPAYLRPIEKRIDEGLIMRWRWSPYLREMWREVVEEREEVWQS